MPAPGLEDSGADRTAPATLDALARLEPDLLGDLLREAAGLGELTGTTTRFAADEGGPGMRVTAAIDWSVEVAGHPGEYDEEGLPRERVRRLAGDLDDDGWLFVMTPDPPVPAWLADPDGVAPRVRGRVVWVSLAWLADAVREVLADPIRLMDPRSRVALADLLRHYDSSGLLDAVATEPGALLPPASAVISGTPGSRPSGPSLSGPPPSGPAQADGLADTLVVRAEGAWTTYLDHAAYVTAAREQPVTGVEHVAFVRGDRLMAVVPRLLRWHSCVDLTAEEAERLRATGETTAATLVERLVRAGTHGSGPVALAELTPAGDPATTRLSGPLGAASAGEDRLTMLELLTR